MINELTNRLPTNESIRNEWMKNERINDRVDDLKRNEWINIGMNQGNQKWRWMNEINCFEYESFFTCQATVLWLPFDSCLC